MRRALVNVPVTDPTLLTPLHYCTPMSMSWHMGVQRAYSSYSISYFHILEGTIIKNEQKFPTFGRRTNIESTRHRELQHILLRSSILPAIKNNNTVNGLAFRSSRERLVRVQFVNCVGLSSQLAFSMHTSYCTFPLKKLKKRKKYEKQNSAEPTLTTAIAQKYPSPLFIFSVISAKRSKYEEEILKCTPVFTPLPREMKGSLFDTSDIRVFIRARPVLNYDDPSDLDIVRKGNQPQKGGRPLASNIRAPLTGPNSGVGRIVVKRPQSADEGDSTNEIPSGNTPAAAVAEGEAVVLMMPSISISLVPGIQPTPFSCDSVFTGNDSTSDVYNVAAKSLVQRAVEGASTTVLAYGQTGSGKTHTMCGILDLVSNDLKGAFQSKSILLTAVEILGDDVTDLFSGKSVQICEDVRSGIQLLGATSVPIKSCEDFVSFCRKAREARSTKSTDRNDTSSRSHLVIQTKFVAYEGQLSPGVFTIVDLAGSEFGSDSAGHDKDRLSETRKINTSLMCLKECIRTRIMATQSKAHVHIPYRTSRVTLLLRDVFELAVTRPTKTAIIACVSPLATDVRQTHNTLRYAALLYVQPSVRVLAKDPKDPSNFDRPTALEFISMITRKRADPERVLPAGDGATLTNYTEAQFIGLIVASSSQPSRLSENEAKVAYDRLWKEVVDARTRRRADVTKVHATVKAARREREEEDRVELLSRRD